jgi:hypothetical protein
MQFVINNTKRSIIINSNLQTLWDSLINNMTDFGGRPPDTKYLGSITPLDDSKSLAKIKWGCFNLENKIGDPAISFQRLNEVKFPNNLDTMIHYPNGLNSSLRFIFPCLECIRQSFDKKIFFVQTITEVPQKTLIFI